MPARPASRSRPARIALTPTSILDAALIVARREGVEGLSIRKLAAELGVTPMAVYHYFPSKEAILLGVIDRVVGDAAVTAHGVPRSDSSAWLHATFRRIYDALIEQPGIIPLLASTMRVGQSALAVLDEVLGVLRETGLDAVRAVCGFQALMSYTLGAAGLRVRVVADLPDPDEIAGRIGRDATNGLRHVVDLRDELMQLNTHDNFDDGLEVILAGLWATGEPAF